MRLLLSIILSLALFSILYMNLEGSNNTEPQVEANPNQLMDIKNDQTQNTENQLVKVEKVITKVDLVNKVKQIFPNELGSAKIEDFTFDGYNPDKHEEFILNYRKNGDDEYHPSDLRGTFLFYGKELTLIAFSFGGDAATENAVFPPIVNVEESRDVAEKFLAQFYDMNDYGMKISYYQDFQRPLTKPIQTEFEFYKMKDGIRISDQGGRVLVQGDGMVRSYNFYNQPYENYYASLQEHTYDSPNEMLTEEEIKNQLNNDLNVQLKYISRSYGLDSKDIYLAYVIDPSISKINALDGTYSYSINGESMEISKLQAISKYHPILESNHKSTFNLNKNNIEQHALKILEQILKLEQSGLSIEKNEELSVERSLKYLVTYDSNHYAEMIIDGVTGDLYYWRLIDEVDLTTPSETSELVLDEARENAMEYIHQLSPGISQQIVWREHPEDYSTDNGNYTFQFYRLVNGIPYEGDRINVTISKQNGELMGYVMFLDPMDQFPKVDSVTSEEEALSAYLDGMSTDLYYEHIYTDYYADLEKVHYNLIYEVDFTIDYVDAITGENVLTYRANSFKVPNIKVSHPWAEDEINYLIQSGFIVPDVDGQIRADEALSVEEGLNILMKSLYNKNSISNYAERLGDFQTYLNIRSDMDIYPIVESAAVKGIIDTDQETFNLDELLTREKLAFWYVQLLGSDFIAEQELAFNNFADEHLISDKYVQQVKIANAFGLIAMNENTEIRPNEAVTIAELAKSFGELFKLSIMINNDNKFVIH
ncbi:YcdB/YcdC domain-containing protein [Chengkuizengella axinellae]|uniref:S-layer homology domain-containing protein n=1 Tax=Chengkuizengella axinellae TaxID=3064388 RepID=A0ABT9IVY5_9BACL|nr:YcdB/YcdC domain-containing protein [Chengkuizengella sp. 2205SS18-9]MDP5273529.1 S-layer homology domain-containing protein [Chengkuizengella sp. 2205SS18-9]